MKRVISLFLILLLVVSSVPSALAYTPGDNWCINCPVAPDGMGVLCAECMMCPHCEGCICVEENDYSAGTNVEYDAEADNDGDGQPDNTEAYTITVPAKLTPGGEGTVTLSGTWASNRMVTVTAESSVTLVNTLASSDQKILDVLFNGISKAGSNTNAQTFTEKISVADIDAALFGTWSGKFNYNVVSSDAVKKPMFSIMHKPTGAITQPKETFTMYGCDLLDGLEHTSNYEGGFIKEFPAGEYFAEVPGVLLAPITKDFSAEFYGEMSTIEFDRALLNVTAEELGTYMVYTEWPDGSVTGIDFTMETQNGISAACITYKYVDEVGEDSDWGAGPYIIWVYNEDTKTFSMAMGDITAYDGMWLYVDASRILYDTVIEAYENM